MSNANGLRVYGSGWVRAVFSKRCRGFAAPLDLIKKQLRIAHNCGAIKRVREDFANYLVSDFDEQPFSEGRKKYAPRRVGVMNTGFPLASDFGGDIDAPDWIASGAMYWADNVEPFPIAHRRGEV